MLCAHVTLVFADSRVSRKLRLACAQNATLFREQARALQVKTSKSYGCHDGTHPGPQKMRDKQVGPAINATQANKTFQTRMHKPRVRAFWTENVTRVYEKTTTL